MNQQLQSERKNTEKILKKMTKLLVALLVLCVSSASGLLLEDLCPSDAFAYKGGILVNAFHRIRQNVTFEPFEYLVNDNITCDPTEFRDKGHHMMALQAKNR